MRYLIPDKVHDIEGTQLREFLVNGTVWFPLYDVCRLLESSRTPTRIAQALSPDFLIRLKMSDRPPTNMISVEGLFDLISKSPRVDDVQTRAYIFRKWCDNNLRPSENKEADEIAREITILQGEIKITASALNRKTERLETLIHELDAVRAVPVTKD